jgi:hypothetical protein
MLNTELIDLNETMWREKMEEDISNLALSEAGAE